MSARLVAVERLLARNSNATASSTHSTNATASPAYSTNATTSSTQPVDVESRLARSTNATTSSTQPVDVESRLARSTNAIASPSQSVNANASYLRPLRDALGRPLADLRLSVTDRCNFRCTYCMPASGSLAGVGDLHRESHLDFEALMRIASAFVDLGVSKVRLTGGEPLVRRDLPSLVRSLSRLAIRDLCMTTNGSLLVDCAEALAGAGLKRVTVSLDAIDEFGFQRITRGRTSLKRVLSGIEAARRFGLVPVKINMVVQRGANDHAIVDMASWARREGLELRFIEYMDVGCTNGWRRQDVVSAAEIRQQLQSHWELDAVAGNDAIETAERFRYRDGAGSVAFIASITQPFCHTCSRARVTAAGQLYSCLFAAAGFDLASVLREGGDLHDTIRHWWRARSDRYSELRAQLHALPRAEMSVIGG